MCLLKRMEAAEIGDSWVLFLDLVGSPEDGNDG